MLMLALTLSMHCALGGITFNHDFSPLAGMIVPQEGPFRLSDAVGVWQDVFLLAKPQVHVADIFMQLKSTMALPQQ